MLFILIGLVTLAGAVLIAKTMPANPVMDFLSILFRVLYRVELRGVENLQQRRPEPDHRA